MSEPASPLHQHQAEAAMVRRKITPEELRRALDIHETWRAEGRELDLAEAIAEVAGLSQGSVETIRESAKLELLREKARNAGQEKKTASSEGVPRVSEKSGRRSNRHRFLLVGASLAATGLAGGYILARLTRPDDSRQLSGASEESSPSGHEKGLEEPPEEDWLAPGGEADEPTELERLVRRYARLERELVRIRSRIRALSGSQPLPGETTHSRPDGPGVQAPSAARGDTEARETAWQEELLRASDLEAAGDLNEALRTYQRLAEEAKGPIQEEARERLQSVLSQLSLRSRE